MVDVQTFKQWHGQTRTAVLHRVHHVEQQALLVSEELVKVGRQNVGKHLNVQGILADAVKRTGMLPTSTFG